MSSDELRREMEALRERVQERRRDGWISSVREKLVILQRAVDEVIYEMET